MVHELSRLSRLGAGETHDFLEFCLKHETGVQAFEVGLELTSTTTSSTEQEVSLLPV